MTSPAGAAALRLPAPQTIAVAVILAGLAAATAPLVVYAVSLALFGVVHLGTELRYVDERFSARIGPRLGPFLVGALAAVALLRIASVTGAIAPRTEMVVELGLVAALALAVLPRLVQAGPMRAALAVAIAATVALGAVRSTWATLAVLAFVHNLTPVGFLAERLSGRQRARAMIACLVVFGAVPLLLATGLVTHLGSALGVALQVATWGSTGPIEQHLSAFVPPALSTTPVAVPLFSVAAYLQCMHYGAVIRVLPSLGSGEENFTPSPLLPWPPRGLFAVILVVAGIVTLFAFHQSFAETRAVYGVVAAVHAWVEVPVLLLALSRKA